MIEINYQPITLERVIEVNDLKLEINRYGETHIKVNFPEEGFEIIPLQVLEYPTIFEFVWKCKCGISLYKDTKKERDDLLYSLNALTE